MQVEMLQLDTTSAVSIDSADDDFTVTGEGKDLIASSCWRWCSRIKELLLQVQDQVPYI